MQIDIFAIAKDYNCKSSHSLKFKTFSEIFFNKYKIKCLKRFLHYLVGILILYNFFCNNLHGYRVILFYPREESRPFVHLKIIWWGEAA